MTRLPTVLRPLFPLAKVVVVGATRVVSPLTRRVPHWLRSPAPPRHVAATASGYADDHPEAGLTVTEVEPELHLQREMPIGVPERFWVFGEHLDETIEPNVVARIPSGRVVERYGAIVTADDTLLADLSPYWDIPGPLAHPIYFRTGLPPVHRVEGSVAVLITRGIENYYHVLTDVLPRLDLLARAGVEPDRYVVSRLTRFQRETLDHVGIGASRCLEITELRHIEADELVVPSVPDDRLRTPPWIVPFLRRTFLPAGGDEPPPLTRRIYVTRGDQRYTRRVVNERELLDVLEARGFERVDPGAMSVAEQVDLFTQASHIVGAHGAGLTNVAFCSPGAAMVELFAADYVNPCFWRLATTVPGLTYRYLVGDGSPTPVRSRFVRPNRGVASDVVANVTRVAELLDQLS